MAHILQSLNATLSLTQFISIARIQLIQPSAMAAHRTMAPTTSLLRVLNGKILRAAMAVGS